MSTQNANASSLLCYGIYCRQFEAEKKYNIIMHFTCV